MRLKLPASPLFAAKFVFALLAAPVCAAQAVGPEAPLATPVARITAPVSDQVLVPLMGNVHPLAQARYDQGAAPLSEPTGKLQLLLRRSPAQQAALRQLLGSLQDPHSPKYHKWLTPQSFGAQFGIAAQDLETIEAWLAGEGFEVDAVPASRNLIRFSGTLGQVARAFHTSIHSYRVAGRLHVGNVTDPQIPAALAAVVAGVSPLHDFRASAQHVEGARSQVERGTGGRLQVVAPLAQGVRPLLTDPSTGTLYVTPADAATIYNAPNSLNSHYSGTDPQTGSGASIGIAGYSDLETADYLNYRKLFLNEASPASPTLVVDGVDPGVLYQGDGQETLLDAEITAGVAPGAQLFVYSSQSDLMEDGLSNAVLRAIEDNQVSVLTVSYATCEAALGTSGNAAYSELWQEAAAQGISVVVATGDTGAAGCDEGTQTSATQGFAVNGYASTPYTVAVGGSDFDILSTNFSQYVSSAQGAGTTPSSASALGYIPENPWNDSISNNPPGPSATNTPAEYDKGTGTPIATEITAAGGGASSQGFCAAGADPTTGLCSGPLGGYPTPPFQSSVVPPATAPAGVRYLPDVAMFSGSNRQHPVGWAFCSDNLVGQANYTFTDCTPAADGTFSVEGVGGTPTSTAAFAGVLGMVIQSLGGTRLGVADNVLYNLAAAGNGSAIFHDITAGNIAVPCTGGTANCGSNNFLTGYNAGTGYDLASGLGSVDISALIAGWSAVHFTATTTTLEVNGGVTPVAVVHGTSVALATAVSPAGATGTVSVTGAEGQAGSAVNEQIPLAGGAGTLNVNNLPGGSYNVQAYYPGDVMDAPSSSAPPVQITVTPENSTLLFSLQVVDVNSGQAYGNSSPYGAYGFAYAHPEGSSGEDGTATGTVTLLNNGSAFGSQVLNSRGNVAFPLYTLPPGSYSLGASYSGDPSFNPSSTPGNISLAIAKGPTTLAASTPNATLAYTGQATVTVLLGTDSAGNFPTGGITLTANGQSFLGTLVQSLTVSNADQELATFAVPGSALEGGANTLTANYPGDANYLASSATTVITVTGAPVITPTFTLTGPAGGISVATLGTPVTGVVSVTPVNGFTGAVTLSCSLGTSKTVHPPTCTVTPSVTLTGGQAASAVVTINTTAPSDTSQMAADRRPGPLLKRLLGGGGVCLGLCLVFAVPARRRGWRSLLIALLAVGVLGTIGCGFTAGSGLQGTPAGSYTATVTGSSGSTTASTTVSLTIP